MSTKVNGRRWLALGAVLLSALVLGLDSTILVTALPTLSATLGATTDQLQWMSTAYLLALSGLLIPAGVLGDRLGRRRMMLVALVIFGLSSVAASRMTTANELILMRAVMGVSGAFIMPISLAVLPTIFSEQERPRAIAIGGAGMFLGLPLGPLVAGWLLTHYEWGSIFLINAPIVVVALIGVWLFIPESRDSNAPRLDFVGAVLAIAGVTSLVYGVIEQPRVGWTAPTVARLICGATLLAGFTTWELRVRSPLVDLRLFLNPRFSWSIAVSVVMNFGLMGVLFVFTPFLQLVQGNDAQATGIRLLPLIAGIVMGAAVSDRLIRRLGVQGMFALGLVICAAGMAGIQRHPRRPARIADRGWDGPGQDPPAGRLPVWRGDHGQRPQQRLSKRDRGAHGRPSGACHRRRTRQRGRSSPGRKPDAGSDPSCAAQRCSRRLQHRDERRLAGERGFDDRRCALDRDVHAKVSRFGLRSCA